MSPGTKCDENFTAVITIGLQGGLDLDTPFGTVSLFGNLGSIDLIGVRDNKFAFFDNSRSGSEAGGAIVQVSHEVTHEEEQLDDGQVKQTKKTTSAAGTPQSTYGIETVEERTIDPGDQNSAINTEFETVQENTVIKESYGTKAAALIGIEISYSEEQRTERKPEEKTN